MTQEKELTSGQEKVNGNNIDPNVISTWELIINKRLKNLGYSTQGEYRLGKGSRQK